MSTTTRAFPRQDRGNGLSRAAQRCPDRKVPRARQNFIRFRTYAKPRPMGSERYVDVRKCTRMPIGASASMIGFMAGSGTSRQPSDGRYRTTPMIELVPPDRVLP
jgi:hypothetical protein